MSFINLNANKGTMYQPGQFLADPEHCTRVTRTIKADDPSVKTASNGGKFVPMGATYKESVTTGSGETQQTEDKIVGVVYEDTDVTNGDAAGSVVTAGTIYKDLLVTPSDADALKEIGFIIVDSVPATTRPEEFNKE